MSNEIKIYFDDRILLLTCKGKQIPAPCKILMFDPTTIAGQIAAFSASTEKYCCISHSNINELLAAVQACFKPIEAAGGAVSLPDDRLLLIRRLGKWDLPKGKAEQGETPEQTAVREVVEECGLAENPVITGKLADTYHTYYLEGVQVLKHTSWFAMRYSGAEALLPQYAEDITKALWCTAEEVHEACKDTYGSVKDVLETFLQSRSFTAPSNPAAR